MANYVFGVDIGGTTVKIGLFSAEGQLLDKWEITTRTDDGGAYILGDIADSVKAKMEEKSIAKDDVIGVGMGVPGPVKDDGTVIKCVNLGWGVFNAAEELGKLLDMKVKVGNDANMAALGEYWQGGGNSGYSGNWELADLPEQFKIDVLGYIKDENGVLVEDADAETKPFAFLFQMEGDVHARRHVLYNTVATRPEHTANTIAENKEPITDSLPITCKPIYNEALGKNIPKASVEQGEPAYASWFESVYQTTVTQTPEEQEP